VEDDSASAAGLSLTFRQFRVFSRQFTPERRFYKMTVFASIFGGTAFFALA